MPKAADLKRTHIEHSIGIIAQKRKKNVVKHTYIPSDQIINILYNEFDIKINDGMLRMYGFGSNTFLTERYECLEYLEASSTENIMEADCFKVIPEDFLQALSSYHPEMLEQSDLDNQTGEHTSSSV